MNEFGKFAKPIGIYYAKAFVFSVLSYGLLLLIYGQIRISFVAWIVIMLAAFTIAFAPGIFRMLRGRDKQA